METCVKYITVKPCGGCAGVGHQFTNFLVPYILSKKYNLKFVYQPFVGETDGTLERKGTNFYQITVPVKLWNDFLNFGEGELTLKDLPERFSEIQLPMLTQGRVTWDRPQFTDAMKINPEFDNLDVLFKVNDCGDGQFIDMDWDFYKNNDLKQKYNNSKQIKNFKCYFNKDKINIAIHIRRGDVTKENGYRRWMDLQYYLKIIENVDRIKFNKPLIYHMYMFDMPEEELKQITEFKDKNNINIEVHNDEDVFSTFYHFTRADIFVCGQGSLSLLANYLTDAVKLTTPWKEFINGKTIVYWDAFPKDINDIVEVNPDSSFDENKLRGVVIYKNE